MENYANVVLGYKSIYIDQRINSIDIVECNGRLDINTMIHSYTSKSVSLQSNTLITIRRRQ